MAMQYIFLVNPDFSAYDASRVNQLLHTLPSFHDLRENLTVGELLSAEYGAGEDAIQFALSEDATAITLSWTSTDSLSLALLLQRSLGTEMRMFDTQYSFDIMLTKETTLRDLGAAIDAARGER